MSKELKTARDEVLRAFNARQAVYHRMRITRGTPEDRRALQGLEAAFRAASARCDQVLARSRK